LSLNLGRGAGGKDKKRPILHLGLV
jgi:hypothetical protein